MKPTLRKPVGVLAIIAMITVYAVLVASAAPVISGWPALAQAPVYLVAGIVWILPLKPLLRWMETGKWKAS